MDLHVRYGSDSSDVYSYTATDNTFYQDPDYPHVCIRTGTGASEVATYGVAHTSDITDTRDRLRLNVYNGTSTEAVGLATYTDSYIDYQFKTFTDTPGLYRDNLAELNDMVARHVATNNDITALMYNDYVSNTTAFDILSTTTTDAGFTYLANKDAVGNYINMLEEKGLKVSVSREIASNTVANTLSITFSTYDLATISASTRFPHWDNVAGTINSYTARRSDVDNLNYASKFTSLDNISKSLTLGTDTYSAVCKWQEVPQSWTSITTTMSWQSGAAVSMPSTCTPFKISYSYPFSLNGASKTFKEIGLKHNTLTNSVTFTWAATTSFQYRNFNTFSLGMDKSVNTIFPMLFYTSTDIGIINSTSQISTVTNNAVDHTGMVSYTTPIQTVTAIGLASPYVSTPATDWQTWCGQTGTSHFTRYQGPSDTIGAINYYRRGDGLDPYYWQDGENITAYWKLTVQSVNVTGTTGFLPVYHPSVDTVLSHTVPQNHNKANPAQWAMDGANTPIASRLVTVSSLTDLLQTATSNFATFVENNTLYKTKGVPLVDGFLNYLIPYNGSYVSPYLPPLYSYYGTGSKWSISADLYVHYSNPKLHVSRALVKALPDKTDPNDMTMLITGLGAYNYPSAAAEIKVNTVGGGGWAIREHCSGISAFSLTMIRGIDQSTGQNAITPSYKTTTEFREVTETVIRSDLQTYTRAFNGNTFLTKNVPYVYSADTDMPLLTDTITIDRATYFECNNVGFENTVPETITFSDTSYYCGSDASMFRNQSEHTINGYFGGYDISRDQYNTTAVAEYVALLDNSTTLSRVSTTIRLNSIYWEGDRVSTRKISEYTLHTGIKAIFEKTDTYTYTVSDNHNNTYTLDLVFDRMKAAGDIYLSDFFHANMVPFPEGGWSKDASNWNNKAITFTTFNYSYGTGCTGSNWTDTDCYTYTETFTNTTTTTL